jgi:hypothetical protein
MEQTRNPSAKQFVLVWCVLGGLTSLGISVVERYGTRYLDSVQHIVGRLAVFMALGALYGLALHRYPMWRNVGKPTRARTILRTVLFVVLMLGLAFILWSLGKPDTALTGK